MLAGFGDACQVRRDGLVEIGVGGVADVLVVGGGLVGLTAALLLAPTV